VAVNGDLERSLVECHADGHQWRHHGFVGAPDWTPPLGMHGAIARHSFCSSCGMERARWYTRSGEAVNRYKPREGYYYKRSAPDDFAPSRLEWRKTLVVSLFAEFEQAVDQAPRKRGSKQASG
jgi:hypothetical protein